MGTEDFGDDIGAEQLSSLLSSWMVRIGIRPDKLVQHSITMETIGEIISDMFDDMHVIVSPDNMDDEHPFIYLRLRREMSPGERPSEDAQFLQSVYRVIMRKMLEELCVGGIQQIKSAWIAERPVIGAAFEHANETVLITDGVSRRVLTVHSKIDPMRLTTTSISKTHEMFGIEAARRMFESEVLDVMQMSGVKVNPHHVALIADIFTTTGYFVGFHRPDSVLAGMAFNRPVAVAIRAALYGTEDPLDSMAAHTFLGLDHCPSTVRADLLLDADMLDKCEPPVRKQPGDFFFEDGPSPDARIMTQAEIDAVINNMTSPAYGFSPNPEALFSPAPSGYTPMSPTYQTTEAYSPMLAGNRDADYFCYGPNAVNRSPSYSPGVVDMLSPPQQQQQPYQKAADEYTPTMPESDILYFM